MPPFSVSKSPCHFERSEAESRDLRMSGLKNVQIVEKCSVSQCEDPSTRFAWSG